MLRSVLSDVFQFCYPSACVVCDAPVEGVRYCAACRSGVDVLRRAAACVRCGKPVGYHDAPCPHCVARGVRPFERIVRLGIFEEPLRSLIHTMKYRGRWTIGEMLADEMVFHHEPTKALLSETQVLVPVPLHPRRQIARGYNQADVIARRIAWLCRRQPMKVASGAAARVRHTPPQVRLTSQAQRTQNVRGAFELRNPKPIAGKHVVLVDDVMTTGATLRYLARALLPAKPASISALVIAIADPKGKAFQSV